MLAIAMPLCNKSDKPIARTESSLFYLRKSANLSLVMLTYS